MCNELFFSFWVEGDNVAYHLQTNGYCFRYVNGIKRRISSRDFWNAYESYHNY